MTSDIPSLSFDVFVSYATVDDTPSQNGWVAAFVKHLGEELHSAFGVRAENRLWWDRSHIDTEENLHPQIQNAVQTSACLVVILSRGYVSSKWCRAEREAFFRSSNVESYPMERVFLIDIGNLPVAERPVEFNDIRGRYFWQDDAVAPNDNHRIRIGHPIPDSDNTDHATFFSEVRRLAEKIASRSRRLRRELDQFGTLERLRENLKKTVGCVSANGFEQLVAQTELGDHSLSKSEFCRILIQSPLVKVSFAINEVLEQCAACDVEHIGKLLDCLLPLRYCDDLADLQDSMVEKSLRLVEQRAGDASIAEIIMAGIDCRPAACTLRTGGKERIVGRTALEVMEAPETGPDDQIWSVELLLRDLVQQVAAEFQGANDQGVGSVKSLATRLNGWIGPYSQAKKMTVYGLVQLSRNGTQRSAAIACLQEVCNLVPKLAFVEIVSREDEADEHEASILHVIRCRQKFGKR